jgi:pyrroline-5-carboxylate reductase
MMRVALNVGLLGCGHIASALAQGWTSLAPAAGRPVKLWGYDIRPEAVAHLSALSGLTPAATPQELADRSDVLIVAVRPTEVSTALAAVEAHLNGHPVVSLAAGVSIASLLGLLPDGAMVGRAIPNVAVERGCGLVVWANGTLGAHVAELRDLFALLGTVVDVPEHLFEEATVVSACGPGFAALFIEAFEEAGVAVGLDWQTSSELALGAVAGTVELVRHSGDTGAVRRAVSTPGGMTIAGIEQLELARLRPALMAAVRAAVDRGRGKK